VVADVGIEDGLAHHHLRHSAQIHGDGATPSLLEEEEDGQAGREGRRVHQYV
jgi:hypothetical protein